MEEWRNTLDEPRGDLFVVAVGSFQASDFFFAVFAGLLYKRAGPPFRFPIPAHPSDARVLEM